MTWPIAFVLPSLAGGGAERVTLTLMDGLPRDRFSPHLFLLDDSGPLVPPEGIPVSVIGESRLRAGAAPLIRALRMFRPAATFSSLAYVNLALAAARPLFGGRLILREANLPSISLARARLGRVMTVACRLLYPRADRMIAISAGIGDELRAMGVPATRLRAVANPVDEEGLRRSAAIPRRFPGSGIRLVAAGRLVPQKGLDRLIPLLAGYEGLHLTLLGDGPMRDELAASAARHGVQLEMPGYRTDAAAWYAGADCVVLPSRWEGMPNVALDALACGTPVVATPEAGGIAAIAAAAPAGAVTVAAFDEAFAAALRAVTARGDAGLRPSLLPPCHRLDHVNSRFAAIMDELLSEGGHG